MAEQIYLVFNPTRLAFLKWYLVAFIFIVVGIFVVLSVFEIIKFNLPIPKEYSIYTVSIPIMGIVFILIAILLRKIETYIITNYRIIERRGIINRREDSINWEKISNYTLTQNAIDRIFNIGTVHLHSVGGKEEEAEVIIKKAPNIHKVKAFLDKLIERKEEAASSGYTAMKR